MIAIRLSGAWARISRARSIASHAVGGFSQVRPVFLQALKYFLARSFALVVSRSFCAAEPMELTSINTAGSPGKGGAATIESSSRMETPDATDGYNASTRDQICGWQ